MVGILSKTVLGNMLHILSLRHSCLLENHAMAFVTVMCRRLVVGYLVGDENTSPCLLLPQDLNGSVAVR